MTALVLRRATFTTRARNLLVVGALAVGGAGPAVFGPLTGLAASFGGGIALFIAIALARPTVRILDDEVRGSGARIRFDDVACYRFVTRAWVPPPNINLRGWAQAEARRIPNTLWLAGSFTLVSRDGDEISFDASYTHATLGLERLLAILHPRLRATLDVDVSQIIQLEITATGELVIGGTPFHKPLAAIDNSVLVLEQLRAAGKPLMAPSGVYLPRSLRDER